MIGMTGCVACHRPLDRYGECKMCDGPRSPEENIVREVLHGMDTAEGRSPSWPSHYRHWRTILRQEDRDCILKQVRVRMEMHSIGHTVDRERDEQEPKVGRVFRHYRTKGLYTIVAVARVEARPDRTEVIYRSADGATWARPTEDFCAMVDDDNSGHAVRRFERYEP